jgi:glycine cleavage system transcriptional repressor
MMKRTERHHSLQYDISASAEVLIRDQPGIVSQCTQFFSDHGWDIQAMQPSPWNSSRSTCSRRTFS